MFRVLKSAVAVVVVVALQPSAMALAAATVPPTASGQDGITTGGVMQVVAHQDDDLLFMNPDVNRSITAGVPSVTVYLTAGEMTGDGNSAGERARNRQRGAQNAYAAMAGIADSDDTSQLEWDGDAWQVAGKTVERYRLRTRPTVQLVFLNLHDGNLKSVNAGVAGETVVPAEGLVATRGRYTRSEVLSVIGGLLSAYQPTLLRIQDPEPDQRYRSSTSMLGPSHPDHVSGGLLAREASGAYSGPLSEVAYRDYNTTDCQANLASAEVARKTAIMERYYTFDRGFQRSHLGDPWLDRQYYRWSRGTGWATVDSAGRLEVFVVRGGQVRRYTRAVSGEWSGPSLLPSAGGRLASGVAAGQEADGRLAVFAHRLSDHHVVVLRQGASGGGFATSWVDLGRPDAGSASPELVGTPVVAAGGDGRLTVFVRNARDGVSVLSQATPGGAWDAAAWTSLPGSDVQDGLSVVSTRQRGIELFASTRSKLLHWQQSQVTGGFALDSAFPLVPAASPPHAVVDAGGRVMVAYLQPGTADVRLIHEAQPEGSGWEAPVSLGATGETAEPAMTLASGGEAGLVMLFARNRTLGVSGRVWSQQAGGSDSWTDLAGSTFEQPVAVTDAGGGAVVVVIGPGGVSAGRVSVAGVRPDVGSWVALDIAAK